MNTGGKLHCGGDKSSMRGVNPHSVGTTSLQCGPSTLTLSRRQPSLCGATNPRCRDLGRGEDAPMLCSARDAAPDRDVLFPRHPRWTHAASAQCVVSHGNRGSTHRFLRTHPSLPSRLLRPCSLSLLACRLTPLRSPHPLSLPPFPFSLPSRLPALPSRFPPPLVPSRPPFLFARRAPPEEPSLLFRVHRPFVSCDAARRALCPPPPPPHPPRRPPRAAPPWDFP